MNKEKEQSAVKIVDEPVPDGPVGDAAKGTEKNVESNMVRESLDEILGFSVDMSYLKEELVAFEIPMQTINVMVEHGFNGNNESLQTLMSTAISASEKSLGGGSIKKCDLEARVASLIALEKDLAFARRVAKQQGLNLQVLNFLVQIIRQNPGDNGEKAINEFVAYAIACSIPFDQAGAIVSKVGTSDTGSVLPNIPRMSKAGAKNTLKSITRDVAVGIFISAAVLWLVI